MSEDRTRWYDRALPSNVVGGLIVAALVWFVPWAISTGTVASVPSWVYAVVAVSAALLATFIVPLWRRSIWGNILKFIRWFLAIRPVTAKQHEALKTAGYQKHKREVAAAREAAKQPRWSISAEDRLFGDIGLHWLTNHGYAAHDVRLTADPSEFVTDGEVFFRGVVGGATPGASTGKQFRGAATEKGRKDGVTFTVNWYDDSSNAHERAVLMSPEEIRRGRDSAIKEARTRGREEGYAQAKESYEKAMAEAVESTQPAVPRPAPRWMVGPENTDKPDVYVLCNSVPRSIAREVRLDADPDFKIIDAGHWQDLSGTETTGASGTFIGVMTSQGETFGVNLHVKWYDEHSKPQSTTLFLRGPDETSMEVSTTLVI